MNTALVLAGGGAKGAYQAGSIKALKELNYDFDLVTGTSIGALNGLLVVQEDYQALYHLWDKMTINDIFLHPVNFDFSIESLISNSNLIKPFFKSYISEKGGDITPLKKLLHSLYDDKKARSSKIDYGLVTVKYPSLTPLEITKQQMSQPIVEYALASASCFPAFPVHYINNQGYIDGGYYDNLPISLSLASNPKTIIAIELNQEPGHEHFLNRPNITLIRPSHHLGNFLDFSRDILDYRIKLGYNDTYKTFNHYQGYSYTFIKEDINQNYQNKIYQLILNYEDQLNRSFINKTMSSSKTPLTDLLKKDTYLNTLNLSDYFIRSLEITMEYYHYSSTNLYHIDHVIEQLFNQFNQDYYQKNDLLSNQIRQIPIKKILDTIKSLSSKDAIMVFYHSLIHQEPIEPGIISNIFLVEYLIALFFYSLK